MIIAVSIEEIIRYLFIKNRTIKYINHKLSDSIIYGLLLGIGFVTLELLFAYLSNSEILNISAFLVASIHIISSIFLLYIASYQDKFPKDIPYIIIVITFHVLGNLFLFQYFFIRT